MFFFIFFLFLVFPHSSDALQAHCRWQNNWTQNNPATQNIVKRTTDDGTETAFYTPPGATDFIDTNIQEGIPYIYQIFAQNTKGVSDGSNVACATLYNGLIAVFPIIPTVSGTGTSIPAPAANIISIQYQIDGVNYGPENTVPPFSFVLADSSTLTNGNHTLTALIKNSNGTITSSSQTFAVQNSVTPPAPLVAYEMDEGSGNTINDSSGRGNNATMVNMTWIMPGQNGTGSALQGAPNGKVVVSSNVGHATVRTYTIWTKRTGPGGNNFGRIFDKRVNDREVELLYNDEGPKVYRFIRVWSTGIGHWTIPQPSLNVWHHIAIVYDSSSAANNPLIYVDGVAQVVTRASDPSGTPLMNTDPYVLGNRGSSDRNWSGILDRFRIYDGALSTSEIQATMNGN